MKQTRAEESSDAFGFGDILDNYVCFSTWADSYMPGGRYNDNVKLIPDQSLPPSWSESHLLAGVAPNISQLEDRPCFTADFASDVTGPICMANLGLYIDNCMGWVEQQCWTCFNNPGTDTLQGLVHEATILFEDFKPLVSGISHDAQ